MRLTVAGLLLASLLPPTPAIAAGECIVVRIDGRSYSVPPPPPPIAVSGPVCGRVLSLDLPDRSPLPLLPFELKDNDGRIVRSFNSDVDGGFTVTGLPDGRYRLTPPPGFAHFYEEVLDVRDAQPAACRTPLYVWVRVSSECVEPSRISTTAPR